MPCSAPRPPHAAGAPPRPATPRRACRPRRTLTTSRARRHGDHLLAPRTSATPRGALLSSSLQTSAVCGLPPPAPARPGFKTRVDGFGKKKKFAFEQGDCRMQRLSNKVKEIQHFLSTKINFFKSNF